MEAKGSEHLMLQAQAWESGAAHSYRSDEKSNGWLENCENIAVNWFGKIKQNLNTLRLLVDVSSLPLKTSLYYIIRLSLITRLARLSAAGDTNPTSKAMSKPAI